MTTANPYEAALAELYNEIPRPELQLPLAGRRERLVASLFDSIAIFVVYLPWAVVVSMLDPQPHHASNTSAMIIMILSVLTVALTQLYLLSHGQTLGKKLLGLRIVKVHSQENPGLLRLLSARILPINVLLLLPGLGTIVALLNVLLIFREDRRCLHDLIAGTIVVQERGLR